MAGFVILRLEGLFVLGFERYVVGLWVRLCVCLDEVFDVVLEMDDVLLDEVYV